MLKFILPLMLLAHVSVVALPASQLKTAHTEILIPYLENQGMRSHFIGSMDLQVEYIVVAHPNPKGVIILSPGQSEPFLKYAEVMYDLRDLGYTIYAIDHRGQGFSQRMLPERQKSHVERFEHYVYDLSQLILDIVHPELYDNSFILAHSMGAAIASGFMRKYPKVLTGAILNTPMLSINTGNFQQGFAGILSKIMDLVVPYDFAPGQGLFDEKGTFETDTVTSSIERYNSKRELYRMYPELKVAGTTVRWVKESLDYTWGLRQTERLYQVPTLMFQAGRDTKVNPDGQNEACEARSAEMCKLIIFPEAQHEILMERDEIRDEAFRLIRDFIRTHER